LGPCLCDAATIPAAEGVGELVIRTNAETPAELPDEYIPYCSVGSGLVGVDMYWCSWVVGSIRRYPGGDGGSVTVGDVCKCRCLQVQAASLNILQVDCFDPRELGHFFHDEFVVFALVEEPRLLLILYRKVVVVVEFPSVSRVACWDILPYLLSVSAEDWPRHSCLQLEGCHLCS